MTSINFNDDYKDVMKDLAFKRAYEAEYEKLTSAVTLMRARESAGLTQGELALKAKVPQSTVAKVESGSNTSFEALSKIASALDKPLTVSFN